MSFKYQDDDPDAVRSAAEGKGDYDNPIKDKFKTLRLKEGKHRLRILPRTWSDNEGPRHWSFPVFLHYGIGPDNVTYLCPAKMGKGECPICTEQKRLYAEGDEEGAKELRAAPSQLCWVIDRNHEEEGPMALFMPAKKVHSVVNELSRDETTGMVLQISHPEEGRDITFRVSGEKRRKEYSAVAVAPKSSFLCENQKEEEEWLNFIQENPLPTILRYYDAAYLDRVFGGGGGSRRTEDDAPRRSRSAKTEEEPPRAARRERTEVVDDAPPARSRRAPADDDIDAPPARSTRAAAPAADADDAPPRSRRGAQEKEEDTPTGRRSSARGAPGDEEPPARSRRAAPAEETEEAPPRRAVREEAPEGLRTRRRE